MTIGWFLQYTIWPAIAALGFAMLFNVPTRTLAACALGAAAGYLVRAFCLEMGAQIEVAVLAGATVVGFLGVLFARIWKAPAPVFTVPGVIPMVPGSFAFKAMMGVVELAHLGAGSLLLIETVAFATKAALILGGIAIGIALPNMLFRRQRPVI